MSLVSAYRRQRHEFKTILVYIGSLRLAKTVAWVSVSKGGRGIFWKLKTSGAVMAYAFNPSTQEAEAGGFLSSRPAWSTEWVPGQPGIHRETLSRKTKERREEREREREREREKWLWAEQWHGPAGGTLAESESQSTYDGRRESISTSCSLPSPMQHRTAADLFGPCLCRTGLWLQVDKESANEWQTDQHERLCRIWMYYHKVNTSHIIQKTKG
jgi:hypothetical protein